MIIFSVQSSLLLLSEIIPLLLLNSILLLLMLLQQWPHQRAIYIAGLSFSYQNLKSPHVPNVVAQLMSSCLVLVQQLREVDGLTHVAQRRALFIDYWPQGQHRHSVKRQKPQPVVRAGHVQQRDSLPPAELGWHGVRAANVYAQRIRQLPSLDDVRVLRAQRKRRRAKALLSLLMLRLRLKLMLRLRLMLGVTQVGKGALHGFRKLKNLKGLRERESRSVGRNFENF